MFYYHDGIATDVDIQNLAERLQVDVTELRPLRNYCKVLIKRTEIMGSVSIIYCGQRFSFSTRLPEPAADLRLFVWTPEAGNVSGTGLVLRQVDFYSEAWKIAAEFRKEHGDLPIDQVQKQINEIAFQQFEAWWADINKQFFELR